MATLKGTTISETYPLLLKIASSGLDGTLRDVEDGDGTASALKISSGAIQVDNIKIDGNAITSTDSNGNIDLTPDGSGEVKAIKALSSDTQTTPETILTLGAKYTSTGADGGAGSGSRIEFQIPDDETNPITGTAIAGIKESADDSDASAGMAFYVSQNDTTLDEVVRIDHDGNLLVGKTLGTSGNLIETNGRISAGAGSSGQPTFNCEGDTNTGINLPESDRIQFITGGSEAVRIDSSQRVGIGTTSPQNDVSGLHVSVASSTDQLYLERTGSGTGRYYLGTSNNSFFIVDDAQSATRLMIDSSGKVGIGTTSPSEVLQVNHSASDGDSGILIVNESTSIANDTFLGGIGFDSADGNVPSTVGEASAAIVARSAEAHGTGDKGGNLLFLTSAIDDDDDTGSHERMRITSEGNVGINEDTPITKLDVRLDSTSTDLTNDYAMFINNQTGAVSDRHATIGFGTYNNGGLTNVFGAVAEGTGAQSGFAFLTHNGGSLNEKLRIANDGTLIIKASTPTIQFQDTDDGSVRGIISQNSTVMDLDSDSDITFSPNNAEKMRITSGGKVLIGTTSGNNTHDKGLRIVSNEVGSHYGDTALSLEGSGGDFYALNFAVQSAFFGFLAASSPDPDFLALAYRTGSSDTTLIQFFANGNATLAGTLTENSDIRLKEGIENIDGALDKVNQMRGVTFNRIDTGNKEYGMIAQELEEIIPELVDTADDGDIEKEIPNVKSIKYTKLTSILIEAVKELSAKNDELTARIEALEA